MSKGMSYDEYWNGDAWAAYAYNRTYDLRLEQASQEAWLQGLYIFDAVSKAIYNALRKKGSSAEKYMEKPIRLTPLTDYEEAALARKERENTIAYFTKLESTWQRNEPKDLIDVEDYIICPWCEYAQAPSNVCVRCHGPLGESLQERSN